LASGVPDVIFSNQKFQFGYILWDVGILWPFGISYGHFMVIWYIFPRFGMLCQEKSGNPVSESERRRVIFQAVMYLNVDSQDVAFGKSYFKYSRNDIGKGYRPQIVRILLYVLLAVILFYISSS
jgi:hypothetical protein